MDYLHHSKGLDYFSYKLKHFQNFNILKNYIAYFFLLKEITISIHKWEKFTHFVVVITIISINQYYFIMEFISLKLIITSITIITIRTLIIMVMVFINQIAIFIKCMAIVVIIT